MKCQFSEDWHIAVGPYSSNMFFYLKINIQAGVNV
jgi:hypothetical protein